MMRQLRKKRLEYLRKSRSDDPLQTVEEVLAKHEAILREYTIREFGEEVPEEDIYREVVSGESIDDRVEIKKLLARIEDPEIDGIVVIEPQRLSRGDLEDCGRLINALRFSKTKVYTPMMTYDLERKMDRKFFQDELLRGREYLEYTKEILFRGRVASVRRGCYVSSKPVYGYKRVKIGRDWTLEVIPEEADAVRLMFKWYLEGEALGGIARRLNEMGVKTQKGSTWSKATVRRSLRNIHYTGKVIFNQFKDTPVLEGGEVKIKKLAQPEDEVIIVEGKHPAIIDQETFDRAQELLTRNPSVNLKDQLINPLAGLLVCAKCGRAYAVRRFKNRTPLYVCPSRPQCHRSLRVDVVMDAVLYALENSELPALELKVKNGDGDARKIQERLLAKLTQQMEEYRAQEEQQYEMLETKRYTPELFDRRNAALRAKMEECEAAIYKARAVLPPKVDYAERVATLKDAIEALKDPEATPNEKNAILKTIVDRLAVTCDEPVGKLGCKAPPAKFRLDVYIRL